MTYFRRLLARFRGPALVSIGAGTAFVLSSSRARAIETEVDSTSVAQSYTLGSPWGGLTVKKRRFIESLALNVYHLEGGDYRPGGADYSVRMRMRLDADAGINAAETGYTPNSDTFVPGLSVAPVDLMYAYVEGRNIAKGWLGFRLGRQYVSDSLGWWAFDGGLVRITTPIYFEIEGYGGLEERGGLPLSTPRFEKNGVWRGDRAGIPDSVYTQFEKANIAPSYGAALQSTGVTWIHGRLDYRKVLNQGNSTISLLVPDPVSGAYLGYSGTRTSSERLGYALDASAMSVGGIKGGLVYDLFNKFFAQYYAQADWYATKGITLSGDYEFFRPTFDGDSIFNFFTHNPMKTITGRLAIEATDEIDLAAAGGIRTFTTDGDPANYVVSATQNPPTAVETDILANFSGRYRTGGGLVGARGMSETGDRGRRQGGDLYGERYWMGRRWTALARVSVYDWVDKARPDRNATSFSYVVGGAFQPSPVAQAMLEWEHDMNRLVGQRFRILALVNLVVTK